MFVAGQIAVFSSLETSDLQIEEYSSSQGSEKVAVVVVVVVVVEVVVVVGSKNN